MNQPLEQFTPEEDARWKAHFAKQEKETIKRLREENDRLTKEVARLRKELRDETNTLRGL